MTIGKVILPFGLVAGIVCCLVSASSPSTTYNNAAPATINAPKQKGNFIVGGINLIKDSLTQTSAGIGKMFSDRQVCNQIRAKQKRHVRELKTKWQGLGIDEKEMRQRLKEASAGITYEEYLKLKRGEEDRTKILRLLFLVTVNRGVIMNMIFFAPNLILPNQILEATQGSKQLTIGETPQEALSRERCHGILKMLMGVERGSHVKPASLIPFTGNGQQKMNVGIGQRLLTATITDTGRPEGALKQIDDRVFGKVDWTRKERSLGMLPNNIIRSLCELATSQRSFFDGIKPAFFFRGDLMRHIQRLTDDDNFLVKELVDLDALSMSSLTDACSRRVMGTIGRSKEELSEQLSTWLRCVVTEPNDRIQNTGEFFNGNLARAALMCHNALEGARDRRSCSHLPRLLYENPTPEIHEETDEPKKNSLVASGQN